MTCPHPGVWGQGEEAIARAAQYPCRSHGRDRERHVSVCTGEDKEKRECRPKPLRRRGWRSPRLAYWRGRRARPCEACRRFDSTCGYPGEGPGATQGSIQEAFSLRAEAPTFAPGAAAATKGNTLVIATAIVAAWNSSVDSDIIKHMQVYAWCIQEHKLAERQQIFKARTRGCKSTFGHARVTEKDTRRQGRQCYERRD